MSIKYTEQIGSRSISRNKGSFTASRNFLVYDDDSTVVLTVADAINFSGGVRFSDGHPEIEGVFANSYSIQPVNDRAYTYTVTWNYAQPFEENDAGGSDDPFIGNPDNTTINPVNDGGVLDPPTGGEQEQGEDDVLGDDGVGEDDNDTDTETTRTFNGVSLTTGLALVDGYVAGAAIPANGAETGSAITGGTVVHEGGEPVTVPVPTTEISLSETVFGAYFYLNDVQLKAGKRNSKSFYGFNAGSVLFKGMSVQRQEYNKWDVTYTFIWDAQSHMRQVPNRLDSGEPDWNDTSPPTLDIFFKQPFPSLTDFSFAP
tara:strand:+ start:4114 stop:5058 length:945 start_codon:yes stop_codon:yes gene_type:complete